MLDPLFFTLFCGWFQIKRGRIISGALLMLGFTGSIALACYGFLTMETVRDVVITAIASFLALLVWVYHVLDMRELQGNVVEGADQTLPSPERQRVKSSHASRKTTVQIDEIYSRGRIAYLRGAFGEAKDCFEKLLTEDRGDSDAAFQLGRVHRRLGDFRQAEKYFRQCQQSAGGGKWSEEIKKYLLENKS